MEFLVLIAYPPYTKLTYPGSLENPFLNRTEQRIAPTLAPVQHHPRMPQSCPILLFASKCAGTHIQLLRWASRRNIEIENVHLLSSVYCLPNIATEVASPQEGTHGYTQGHTRIRNVHEPADMPLDRGTAQHQIALVIIVAEPPQVLNRPQTSLAIGHGRIEIMLLALLIDT